MASIIILGGGFGGLTTAKVLRDLLKPDHHITVVDRSAQFHVGAAKTWIVTGEKKREEILRPKAALLPSGVTLVEAEITGINAGKGEVQTERGQLRGDILVFALGADYDFNVVPGLSFAHTFYTIDGAMRLKGALQGFRRGKIVFLVPRTPFKCPPAPYEAAMMVEHAMRREGIRENTEIRVFTIEPAPMATAGPEMGEFIKSLLRERDIAFHPLKKTSRITKTSILFEDGSETPYDLLIAIPPHKAPDVIREAGLTNESGWIPVDPATLRVRSVESSIPLFAIGDNAVVPLPGRYRPDTPLVLPKAGVFAASGGAVVAHQIAALLDGKPAKTFEGKGFCYIEVGSHVAVRGDGSFFSLPHPVMTKQYPDETQYNDKVKWIRDWMEGIFPGI
ncbi:MAG TPA: FAD/NAD(P)-binding oxidoreductase [Bacteroidota bacterium]|nr:FAD/NAD(P)-binding oxidoreductase [Bacteroidota bacterium]